MSDSESPPPAAQNPLDRTPSWLSALLSILAIVVSGGGAAVGGVATKDRIDVESRLTAVEQKVDKVEERNERLDVELEALRSTDQAHSADITILEEDQEWLLEATWTLCTHLQAPCSPRGR